MHAEGMKYRQTSPWTVGKLLRTKETWFIGIGGGVLVMFTVGIMSNFIPMCASAGIEMNQAIFLMGVTSFIAMPASVIWGIIDEKIGTRMTTIAMFIYFIVSVCIALVPNIITMYIALVMFASIIGGANNLARLPTSINPKDLTIVFKINTTVHAESKSYLPHTDAVMEIARLFAPPIMTVL